MKFVASLSGDSFAIPPIWMMRQAGRYLPEYRELRKQAPTFMDFCFTPRLAVEATLQPIRRFDFDAAILFCDILVVPHCMGQTVSFEEGVGPRLEPIDEDVGLSKIASELDLGRLESVFDAIGEVRRLLPDKTGLIGFCGAPWTVASYMIAGRGTPDQAPARLFAYRRPDIFGELIDRLTQASIEYLCKQIEAGVDAVQIFDSWCGVLPDLEFRKWTLAPISTICREVKKRHPGAKIIVFPRGGGPNLKLLANLAEIDGLGLDTAVPLEWAARELQPSKCLQGNLDPLALIAGGKALEQSIDAIMGSLGGGPFVFNLGHGITPQTPIAHVEQLVSRVRGGA